MSPYRTTPPRERKRRPLLCGCMLPIWLFGLARVQHSAFRITGRACGPHEKMPPGHVWIRCARCDRVWTTPGDLPHVFLTRADEDAARAVGV